MYDKDFDNHPLSLMETILVIAAILGIFALQAACWVWLGMQLAS